MRQRPSLKFAIWCVKVRFIPTRLGDDGKLPVDNILQLVNAVTEGHDEVEIYVSLHGDDPTDNYVLMNVLDIIKTIPDSNITGIRSFQDCCRDTMKSRNITLDPGKEIRWRRIQKKNFCFCASSVTNPVL